MINNERESLKAAIREYDSAASQDEGLITTILNALRRTEEPSAQELIDYIFDPGEDDENGSIRYGLIFEMLADLRTKISAKKPQGEPGCVCSRRVEFLDCPKHGAQGEPPPCSGCGHTLHTLNGGPEAGVCGVILSDVAGDVETCTCGDAERLARRAPETQGEPSDAQVKAATFAYIRSRDANGVSNTALRMNIRAALRAAGGVHD